MSGAVLTLEERMKPVYLLHDTMPQYQIQRRYWVAQINSRPVAEQDQVHLAQVLRWVVLGIVATACLLVGVL